MFTLYIIYKYLYIYIYASIYLYNCFTVKVSSPNFDVISKIQSVLKFSTLNLLDMKCHILSVKFISQLCKFWHIKYIFKFHLLFPLCILWKWTIKFIQKIRFKFLCLNFDVKIVLNFNCPHFFHSWNRICEMFFIWSLFKSASIKSNY